MRLAALFLIVSVAILLGGCEGISKPYVMKVDRTDQKMDVGNRGYLKGTPPPVGDRGDLKRPFLAIDVDLPETGESKVTTIEEERVVETKREGTTVKSEERTVIKEEEIK